MKIKTALLSLLKVVLADLSVMAAYICIGFVISVYLKPLGDFINGFNMFMQRSLALILFVIVQAVFCVFLIRFSYANDHIKKRIFLSRHSPEKKLSFTGELIDTLKTERSPLIWINIINLISFIDIFFRCIGLISGKQSIISALFMPIVITTHAFHQSISQSVWRLILGSSINFIALNLIYISLIFWVKKIWQKERSNKK